MVLTGLLQYIHMNTISLFKYIQFKKIIELKNSSSVLCNWYLPIYHINTLNSRMIFILFSKTFVQFLIKINIDERTFP